jgi:hypothetical protein
MIQNGLVSVSWWTELSPIISMYYGELCRAYMLVCNNYTVWAVMRGGKLLILGCISCGTANAVRLGAEELSMRYPTPVTWDESDREQFWQLFESLLHHAALGNRNNYKMAQAMKPLLDRNLEKWAKERDKFTR